MKFYFSFLCLGVVILSSCSNWKAESLYPVPSQALTSAVDRAGGKSGFEQGALPEDWWTLFKDPQLNEFISLALAQSPSLQKARAQITFAAASADRVKAALFPTLNWNADTSRQKLSTTGVIPFGTPSSTGVQPIVAPTTSSIPEYFTLYETELNFAYEFDFWGKNRNTFRSALGEVQTRVAEEAFARLQLSYAVAQAYFHLQTDYKRESVLSSLVQERMEYRDLIQRRINANVDTALSLQNAEYYLAQAKQTLLALQGDIAVTENLLKALIAGNFEEEIWDVTILDEPLPSVPLPRDLPLHLIARRPDIIAQLWVIESAGRQIEVAKAGFYPDFNLTGFYGYQTIHFREWFKWPSSYFDADVAVSLPIFDGGRLIANLRGSEVNYDLAIIKYNDLVINAAREVLDGIAVLRNQMDQLQVLEAKSSTQEKLYNLSALRVEHNIDTNLDKYLSQGTYLVSQDEEVVAEGNAVQAMLALIKALGGGYDTCYEG